MRIIAFEGCDNLGKTLQASLLKKVGYSVYKSPDYNTNLGQLIKRRLFNKDTYNEGVMSLLFLADLLENYNKMKEDNNEISILDRSFISTIVYQNINYRMIGEINLPDPDLVIYFEGKSYKNEEKDYLESEKKQEEVKERYEKILEKFFKFNYVKIDANKEVNEVHQDILNIIRS